MDILTKIFKVLDGNSSGDKTEHKKGQKETPVKKVEKKEKYGGHDSYAN